MLFTVGGGGGTVFFWSGSYAKMGGLSGFVWRDLLAGRGQLASGVVASFLGIGRLRDPCSNTVLRKAFIIGCWVHRIIVYARGLGVGG